LNTIFLDFFDLEILPVSTSLRQNPALILHRLPQSLLFELAADSDNPWLDVLPFHISNTILISFYTDSECVQISRRRNIVSCSYPTALVPLDLRMFFRSVDFLFLDFQ
jgi:hypothetical protein